MTIPDQNSTTGVAGKNYKVVRRHSVKSSRSNILQSTAKPSIETETALTSNQELAALFATADLNIFPDEVMQNILDYRCELELNPESS